MNSKNKLLIFGDICTVDAHNKSLNDLFGDEYVKELSELINTEDYTIANLEAPVIDDFSPICKCGPTLHVPTSHVKVLKKMGIDALSLANNHILDHGKKGLSTTLAQLSANDIVGWGATTEDAQGCSPLILNIANKKVAIFSFAEKEFNTDNDTSSGANIFDPYIHLHEIARFKEEVDYIVVLYHGGIEHYVYPSPELQKKCRAMVSMGADCILCQHSHCIGTIEHFNNGFILYGQGNAIFGYRRKNSTWNQGLAIRIDPSSRNIKMIPIGITDKGCSVINPALAKEILGTLTLNSSRVSDKTFIHERWKRFTMQKRALYLAMLMGKSRIFNKLNRIVDNKILSLLVSKSTWRTMLNLIRCDSHREVLVDILEQENKKA